MKLLERIGQKIGGSATDEAKKNIARSALNLLPMALSAGSMLLGIIIFRNVGEDEDAPVSRQLPSSTHTTITTNNYFFHELSEETIRRIMEED